MSHRPRPSKRIVLFADGTGSAFTMQESNVWRLYLALDKSAALADHPPQIARYIPGVGTSPHGLIRMIDGATGFGVPANVRHLYRFLCVNWSPGDDIHLAGFSRGAFTVRTLAGMISSQGLMPRCITDQHGVRRAATDAEMDRAVMGAWLAYRSQTAPWWVAGEGLKMNPAIEAVRRLRNGFITLKRRVLRQEPQISMTASQPASWKAGQVRVRMMAVFDTVEAYGVPVAEFRRVINWLLWPIIFRNHRCAAIVEQVRHALSLDDTRLTFHPVRFDLSPRKSGPTPQVTEMWFAGAHSDVGGGYPDDACAMAPLDWMAGEMQTAGLRFDPAALRHFASRRFDAGPIHDSRRGLAQLYRYAPRSGFEAEGTGAAPVLHASVLAKMRHGVDRYAPLTLPARIEIEGLHTPGLIHDSAAAARVARLVGWRRATNWATILCLAGLALIAATPLWQLYVQPPDPPLLIWVKTLLGQLVPSLGSRVILAFQTHWQTTLTLLALILAIHAVNQRLASAIRDASQRIWRPFTTAPVADKDAVPATNA